MPSVVFEKQDIHSLVEHHIALLERFDLKDEEPFSLVYFSLANDPKIDYAKILQNILRKTDALFQDKTDFIILLPSTDWNGATELLAGIQEFLSQPPHDAIATYPEDGQNAKTLMRSLFEKIEETHGFEVKALLTTGA